MTRHIPGFAAGLLAGSLLTAAAFRAPAGVEAATQSSSKVVLENSRVRVKDVTFPPGLTGMHMHELPHVGVVIDGGTLEFRYPDGTSETAALERGGVGFRDANVAHEPVNTGKTPVRVIEVELK